MNTTLAAASGGLSTYLIISYKDKFESVTQISNGILAGLVGITASCDSVDH